MEVLGDIIREEVVQYWPLTNLFFLLGVLTSVPILVKIDQEMRLWEHKMIYATAMRQIIIMWSIISHIISSSSSSSSIGHTSADCCMQGWNVFYWWVPWACQTFGFIQPIFGNNTDLTRSINTRSCSLKIRCTF